jgi:hypothetical protein
MISLMNSKATTRDWRMGGWGDVIYVVDDSTQRKLVKTSTSGSWGSEIR